MSRWVVSYINWFDNNLTSEIVEADSWHDAIFKHSAVAKNLDPEWHADLLKMDPENVKQAFFDCDSMIEAIKID